MAPSVKKIAKRGHEVVCPDFKMKMLSWCLFCRSKAHGLVTSIPAVTGGRHPLPVPRSAGTGPGAPPDTAAEVAQTFRSHSEETPGKA